MPARESHPPRLRRSGRRRGSGSLGGGPVFNGQQPFARPSCGSKAGEQLGLYDTVKVLETEVRDFIPTDGGFEVVVFDDTRRTTCPSCRASRTCTGRSVFHCPYCDGYEVRDQPIAVYGGGTRGVGLALELTI